MSSSIAIPQRNKKERGGGGSSVDSAHGMNLGSSPGGAFAAYGSFGSNADASEPSSSLRSQGKTRRQSLMCKFLSGSCGAARCHELFVCELPTDKRTAATFSKAEHTVINVGDSESPRLVRLHGWFSVVVCRQRILTGSR